MTYYLVEFYHLEYGRKIMLVNADSFEQAMNMINARFDKDMITEFKNLTLFV